MIRIVAGELRKVWQGKVFWMIIAIAVAINLGYIQFSEQIFMSSEREQEISEEPSSLAYKKFDEKLAKVKDRQQFIEEYYKQIKGLLLVEQVQTYQASNSELSVKMAEGMVKEREEEYNRYFDCIGCFYGCYAFDI